MRGIEIGDVVAVFPNIFVACPVCRRGYAAAVGFELEREEDVIVAGLNGRSEVHLSRKLRLTWAKAAYY